MGKMTVFGGCYDGRNRLIVAANSKKAAHAAVAACDGHRISYYSWNEFTSDTGNAEEVAIATSAPGIVFSSPVNGKNFVPLSRRAGA